MVVKLVSIPPSQRAFYVRHTAAVSSFSNRFLSLFLGAYEQDRAALFSATGNCGVSSVETVHGLLEVDDVDVATVTEDEGLHLGVPATGLMTEVGAASSRVCTVILDILSPFVVPLREIIPLFATAMAATSERRSFMHVY